MIYRQTDVFLRYDLYPISSYMHTYDPKNDKKLFKFIESEDCYRLCIPHNHTAIETIYFTHGRAMIMLNGEKFIAHQGDIIIANPFDIHAITTVNKNEYVKYHVINMDMSLISNKASGELAKFIDDIDQGKIKFKQLIRRDIPCSQTLGKALLDIHRSYDKRHTLSGFTMLMADLMRFISLLLENDMTFTSDEPELPKQAVFSKKVVQYVSNNYSLPLTTGQIADELHFNKSYFCRNFKLIFGQTFSDYLNQYRISVAKNLSLDDYHSICDIASAVGYANYNVFSSHFKQQTGISPKEYFK